jgi:hypothetical protein
VPRVREEREASGPKPDGHLDERERAGQQENGREPATRRPVTRDL